MASFEPNPSTPDEISAAADDDDDDDDVETADVSSSRIKQFYPLDITKTT